VVVGSLEDAARAEPEREVVEVAVAD
jgi:hypothetical protein